MQLDILDRVVRVMWMLVLTIWLASAFESSEPIETRRDRRSDAAVFVVSVAWLLLLIRGFDGPLLLPRVPLVRIPGLAITVVGLLFALWSRYYLGRNWDAYITLKHDHKLIRTGPYSIVR